MHALLLLVAATDVTHYDANLTLDLERAALKGRVILTLAADPGKLVLDAGALKVTRVSPGTFKRDGDHLVISGGGRTVTIDYEGTPKKGLKFAKAQAYTSFHTAEWMPCNADPGDRATLKLTVKAPGTLVAVGDPVSADTWELKTPVAPFLFAFAVGKFAHFEEEFAGVRWHYYSARHNDTQLRRLFAAMPAIYRVVSDVAGTPLPSKTYRQVLVEGPMAQEAAGLALIDDTMDDDWVITHELAHQWWAVSVGMARWDDFWLNEGFASYVVALDKERRTGAQGYAREAALWLKRMAKVEPDRPLVTHTWKTPEDASGPVAYSKGALFLHAMRVKMGPAAFFAAVAKYTKDSAGKNVTSDTLPFPKDDLKRWTETVVNAGAEPFVFDVTPELRVAQVEPGVYRAIQNDSNALAVEMGNGSIMLVDALWTQPAMEAFLGWLDVRFGRRTLVAVSTHFHEDRVGGNGALKARKIPIWGSDKTVPLVTKGVPPDHVFKVDPAQQFAFGADRAVVWFPGAGHTKDNVVVWFPKRSLLYGGCLVKADAQLGNVADADLASWPAAIERLIALNAKKVVVGHGDNTDPEVLDLTLRALEEAASPSE